MSIVAKKIIMGSGAAGDPVDDQFNRTSFLSHFGGTNNGVNNVFIDGHDTSSPHTITANGNVTQGSFGPFARPDGEWGVDFDGTGDSLTFTNDATMSLDGDYTFELFFNARTIVIDTQHPNTWLSGTTQLFIHASDRYVGWYAGSADIVKSADDSILTNVWNHVAVVRSGTGSNNTSLYLNGTRVAQTQNTATLGAGSGTARIGSYSASGGNFDGHISNIRILKGTALYSGSSITVPTSALTAITNTKLLTCQSNRFIDNSSTGFALTTVGNPAVTAFGPFLTSAVYDPAVNGASASFDGSVSTNLTAADSADWDFGSDNYTIEFWMYATSSGIQGIFCHWGDFNGANIAWSFEINSTTNLRFLFKTNITRALTVTTGANDYLNQWVHVAAVRNNNVHTVYLNGVSKAATTKSEAMNNCTAVLRVGAYQATYGFDGEICDARIVKGTAVYTGNFTPPTAPLTAITNTKLLLNMADGQAIDSTAQNNLTLYGNAKISTGQAKFGDTSMVFDGTGDYVTLPSDSFTPFGTGDFTIECFARFDAISGQGVFQLGASYLPSAITGPAVFGTSDGGSARWRMYYATSYADNTSNPPSTNTWFHIAFVRASGVSKVYIDGVEVLSENDTTNYTNKFFVIGGAYSSSFLMDGYIDEIRISRMARYTSNFTAPSAAFPDKGQ